MDDNTNRWHIKLRKIRRFLRACTESHTTTVMVQCIVHRWETSTRLFESFWLSTLSKFKPPRSQRSTLHTRTRSRLRTFPCVVSSIIISLPYDCAFASVLTRNDLPASCTSSVYSHRHLLREKTKRQGHSFCPPHRIAFQICSCKIQNVLSHRLENERDASHTYGGSLNQIKNCTRSNMYMPLSPNTRRSNPPDSRSLAARASPPSFKHSNHPTFPSPSRVHYHNLDNPSLPYLHCSFPPPKTTFCTPPPI